MVERGIILDTKENTAILTSITRIWIIQMRLLRAEMQEIKEAMLRFHHQTREEEAGVGATGEIEEEEEVRILLYRFDVSLKLNILELKEQDYLNFDPKKRIDSFCLKLRDLEHYCFWC